MGWIVVGYNWIYFTRLSYSALYYKKSVNAKEVRYQKLRKHDISLIEWTRVRMEPDTQPSEYSSWKHFMQINVTHWLTKQITEFINMHLTCLDSSPATCVWRAPMRVPKNLRPSSQWATPDCDCRPLLGHNHFFSTAIMNETRNERDSKRSTLPRSRISHTCWYLDNTIFERRMLQFMFLMTCRGYDCISWHVPQYHW